MIRGVVMVALLCLAAGAWAQEGQDAGPILVPRNNPPRSEQGDQPDYSSSKQTKIDLSAPGSAANPLEPDQSGINEMRPFNPHQADKDMEVGKYYFKDKNYCAALNRFYSALYYDSRYAEAAFRLAETYEKLGDFADARKNYQRYLDIWARGPLAGDAEKKLADLKAAPDGHLPDCGLIPPTATAGGATEKPTPAGADLGPPR